ncbi:diguanylate cyclase [Edwardsiella hoshinae]|uniref:Bacteriophytochrome cph2 n=1 Tax=Edwardsiella hoshinae TaxID=93378 RepID=A0A376DFF7_9GAMM|nr:EAL domain-containing protein [Edwardsiella hoshinae]AOV97025.1 diguanylate cyclase [Edwardsiella hoshinae]QPR27125.1 EAL domain-containing protein [Edwardsiella hoshinae]STC88394.1 Bacteriophytochrome cph2 [Edwardsiella hoshinae]
MNIEHYHLLSDVMAPGARQASRDILRARLQSALSASEFFLEYLPQWGEDGHIQGAEMQVHWRHPHYGLLHPNQFLAAVVRCDLAAALLAWIAEQSFPLLQRLRQEVNAEFYLSLTLPLCLAEQTALFAVWHHALQAHGLPRSALALIWQGEATQEMDASCLAGLRRLQQQGYGVALAEYGSGYQRLTSLPDLPLDRFYIPATLVSLLPHPEAMLLARLLLRLADQLGIRCIAQGVDDIQRFECLRAMGCRHFQGGYLYRPLSAHRLLVLCRQLQDADHAM